ncbi:HNH endonuclease [Paraburkholderia caledonica]|uniref:HNH endonuclease n=1 Tax=Paraburkholderia caledonica TaxID=134536 RepID=UPI0038B864E0
MSDINEPVALSDELVALVQKKKDDATFTYKDWSSADLEPLRSFIRRHYRKVQKGRCAYCRRDVSLTSAANCHVEHIAPKSKYPQFIFEPKNLCVVCADCNEIKREQEVSQIEPDTVTPRKNRKAYPQSSNGFLIVQPHYDEYDEHILIYRGFYIDRSAKGHFTIGACKLNRRLREFGWDEEIVENDALMEATQKLIDAEDKPTKMAALQRIREACLP